MTSRSNRCTSGFSLIEVTIALGIVAFCMTTLLGLLTVGLASNYATFSETEATSIAASVLTDLSGPAGGTQQTARFKFKLPNAGGQADSGPGQTLFFTATDLPAGQIGANGSGSARYRVSVWLTPPAANQKTATRARVLVTWPAMADPQASSVPSKYSGSVEVSSSLNRN